MTRTIISKSIHFDLIELTEGAFAAIDKPGGAAYCNAGIVDLGEHTLVLDAFDTAQAARDLRAAAETVFSRPVSALLLTHAHSDHWIGAQAFEVNTSLITTETIRHETLEWGAELLEDAACPAEWDAYLDDLEGRYALEGDERVRAGMEKEMRRMRFFMAEMADFQPRYADLTCRDRMILYGRDRHAEFCSIGRGHSADDAVLTLPGEGIAFIGDIGFFHCQPYMGFCDLDLWRKQLRQFQNPVWETLVPGHGPIGGQPELELQLDFFDVLEELIGRVVEQGGSLEQALAIELPEPFDAWLMGLMTCFEINTRYMYQRLGGELPE
jgi:glyoxylase-like metal-dependent hydrolase (beta-lactamase superfamily II)